MQLASKQLMPHTAALLREVLPCLGHAGKHEMVLGGAGGLVGCECGRELRRTDSACAWLAAPAVAACQTRLHQSGSPAPPRVADPDISAAARQVNSDLLEQVQQQQQRGLSSSADSLDSQALLAAIRWGGFPMGRCGLLWVSASKTVAGSHTCAYCCMHMRWRALPAPTAPTPPVLRTARSKQLEGETEVSKLEALQWVHVLLSRDARLLQEQRQLLLLALCDALGAASGGLAAIGQGCCHGKRRGGLRTAAVRSPVQLLLCSQTAGRLSGTCTRAWVLVLQPSYTADRVVTESLAVLASVAEQRDHFPAVMAALLACFRGNGGARLLQVGGWGCETGSEGSCCRHALMPAVTGSACLGCR